MDIAEKLRELTQDILNFGEVISFNENPSDTDFRNACDLFSQYLNHELQLINTNITFQDIRPDVQQTTAQLHQMSELISPNPVGNGDSFKWSGKLLDFCSQLQTLKSAAA